MNPNFSPVSFQEEPRHVPNKEAANKPEFRLSLEETVQLFEDRKSIEWMLKNRRDSTSQRIYAEELAAIKKTMDSFGITEDQYLGYVSEIPEAVS